MNSRELFYRHMAQTSSFPLALEIERAEGMYLYDTNGRKYLDLISGISVSALGHRHPEVIEAVKEQLDRYLHVMVYGEFIQQPQVDLASLLAENLPGELDNVYLVNSGSEAVEGALKLAKRYSGRPNIIAFTNAYHGSSHGALSVTGNEPFKRAFRPLLPNVCHLPFGEISSLNIIDEDTACVIAETVQGEAGVVVPEAAFMKALRRRCDETGALLVLDEIQAGIGRTGKLWAFEHFGIRPDILTLAKGLGGGLPVGAFIAPRDVMSVLTNEPVLGHITTFGGNAVCVSAARACMNVIVRDRLWENARLQGDLFISQLNGNEHFRVRGKGLMIAIELESPEICKALINSCMEKGLLTDWFLFAGNCMRIAPPLVISEGEVLKACGIILDSVKEIYS